MMTLRFDKELHRALTLRVAKYLQETDAAIARRIASAPKDQPIALPEDAELYEQALTMLVTEVLCNVSQALRMVLGPGAEERVGTIAANAVAKATGARLEMDATRKGRAS